MTSSRRDQESPQSHSEYPRVQWLWHASESWETPVQTPFPPQTDEGTELWSTTSWVSALTAGLKVIRKAAATSSSTPSLFYGGFVWS